MGGFQHEKRVLYLALPLVTLLLELLPYGAVCNFANPEGAPWREMFSYFDMTPFGYANFAPLLTAIVTCVILVLLSLYLFTGKAKIITAVKACLGTAVVLSLCPLLLGIAFFSVVGAMITLTLLAELILLHCTGKTAAAPGDTVGGGIHMKEVILSADGDSKVYLVPDVVANSLREYCMEFCDQWMHTSPDAEKYRQNGGLCFNEEDFIAYLNAYIFPEQKSVLVKNLGDTNLGEHLPAEYRDHPYFNF